MTESTASGSTAATVFELLGVVLIARGLALIYLPLTWLWLGIVAFAASYVVEATDRRSEAPRAQPLALDDDDVSTDEQISRGEN
jgi:hypothetical protein